jgi:branched-chain amino acid transport system substrate-binding protein
MNDRWWSGKTTRRKLLACSATTAGALGAAMLVPPPWRAAFGQARPYKLGTLQPLTGVAAAGGKTAVLGVEMAVDRINRAGGINGRPIELIRADDESNSDSGRRRMEKLLVEDKVDIVEGGYLSNVCLACMPVAEEQKVVFMIGACDDTTITTSRCSRFAFRPFDYSPSQAVALAPYLVKTLGRRWHIVYLDDAWGQSTRDAYVRQIKKAGGEITGVTGIPLNTADMMAFVSKIGTDGKPFEGLFGILFGAPAVTFTNQAHHLGLFRRYRYAGDGAVADSTHLGALGDGIEGFVGISRYVPVLDGPLDTPHHRTFLGEARRRLKEIDRSSPDPDRTLVANYEAVNFLKAGIQKSGFRGREDSMKLVEALEGMDVKEGDDFPQGAKRIRKEDHQAFAREFIFTISKGKHRLVEVVPANRTLVLPACVFPKA